MRHILPLSYCALTVLGLTSVGFGQTDPGPEPFTFGVIPDTQVQSIYPTWSESIEDQTRWLRDNAESENIRFVSHIGDLAQGAFGGVEQLPGAGWSDQWQRVDQYMGQLDQANTVDGRSLPYSASLGNHDLLPRGDKNNSADPIEGGAYREYFGASRYQDYDWYGGSDSTEWNHYQTITAGGHEYLHINLEHEPNRPENDAEVDRTSGVNDAINWAQSVIDNHQGMPTIISTHELLTDLETSGDVPTGYSGDGADDTFGEGERTGPGREIWQRLVKPNQQVFMTLNGHEHEGPYREDGEFHRISRNDAGLPVFEVLVNFQDYANPLTGNDPYLRLMEFDPEAGEIRNRTFSPTFAQFNNNPASVTDRLDSVLAMFEQGLPIPLFDGNEDVADVLSKNPFPGVPGGPDTETREEAEQAILNFFGAQSRDDLKNVDFAASLTDRDSQFVFDNLTFNAQGRPVPEPGTAALLGACGLWLLGSRRRRRQ